MSSSQITAINRHSYQYDPGIRRSQQTFTDSSFVIYGCDVDDQLTSADASAAGADYTYSYDAGWNMVSRNGNVHLVNDVNQVKSEELGTITYFYDHKGNRTGRSASSAALTYAYDAENQLTTVHTDTSLTPVGSRWKTEFVYDGKQRLRIRKEYVHNGSSWVLSNETRYVYDGMRVIQERNSANTPTVTYTRGLDLSSTLEGAGGIGGLLARSHGYSGGSWSTHNFYHSDANGNITYMVNSAQTMVASYKYDPFGRIESQSGSLANDNVYRFSSKEALFKTTSSGGPSELYYYGYRFYDAQTGRWLNRDPIQEYGGINLYTFVHNDPTDRGDAHGLQLLLPPVLLTPPPVAPPRLLLPPRPLPPPGTIQNPARPGSWGRMDPQTGKFQECWRFDKGQPGRPGWGGKDHWHYWGSPEHLTEPLPPFQWFTPPPINNVDRVIAPPNTPTPPEGINGTPVVYPPNFV